jgi:hypothetical protein
MTGRPSEWVSDNPNEAVFPANVAYEITDCLNSLARVETCEAYDEWVGVRLTTGERFVIEVRVARPGEYE